MLELVFPFGGLRERSRNLLPAMRSQRTAPRPDPSEGRGSHGRLSQAEAAWRMDGRERSKCRGGRRWENPSESQPRRGLAARPDVVVSSLPLSRAAPGTEEGTFWSLCLQTTWLEAGLGPWR